MGGGIQDAVQNDVARLLVQLIFFLRALLNFNDGDKVVRADARGVHIVPDVRHGASNSFSGPLHRPQGAGRRGPAPFFHHNTALTFSQGVLRAGRTVFHSASSQKVPPRSAHTLQKPAQRSISRAAAKPKHRASAQWASALTVARMPFSAARRNRNGAG